MAGASAAGIGGGGLWFFWNAWVNGRTLAKVRTDDGRVIKLMNPDLLGTRALFASCGHCGRTLGRLSEMRSNGICGTSRTASAEAASSVSTALRDRNTGFESEK